MNRKRFSSILRRRFLLYFVKLFSKFEKSFSFWPFISICSIWIFVTLQISSSSISFFSSMDFQFSSHSTWCCETLTIVLICFVFQFSKSVLFVLVHISQFSYEDFDLIFSKRRVTLFRKVNQRKTLFTIVDLIVRWNTYLSWSEDQKRSSSSKRES